MKSLTNFVISVILCCVSVNPLGASVNAGCSPERVTYSPANPVVGQQVTFVICGASCYEYGLYPSQDQSQGNLLDAIGGTGINIYFDTVYYTFTAPGTYHIGLDRQNICPNIAEDPVTGANSWTLGPEGGPFVGAMLLGGTTGTYCVPLRIDAGNAEIPTIGQWGLMVLGLLLVITGTVAFRRKGGLAKF